ncbi:Predicted nucleic acid-binding protein, contains Zn-ribbon domain (includes truncated derivatives) [Micromonospora sediminimaris]|uniref:Uncharacterized protein n=1 Tax=Micromonospora sediminimaris TaxID=547162 RepID=A0A9W5URI7_9ACTN|nr:hypothetical protein Vse01_28840 [Micromonospora sediminimaris]SFD47346.1 Predicted nucleic acid-binding protein, contains Zn-ribbon domain (includes truncated derivatives) [Micromonospora sediminimaris]
MPTEPQPPDSAPEGQPRGSAAGRGARTARKGGTGDGGRTDKPASRPAEPPAAAPTAEAGGTLPVTGDGEGVSGPQLARAVLDAAKARREAAGRPRRRTTTGSGDGERRLRGYSGPGPDPRDPQPLGAVLNRLVKARGWQQPAAEATVFGAWERVVGAEVAQHSRPVKLENGELTVEARSTAWATQLRLLAGSLLQQIAREVGHNVVRKLHIHGPAAPSWSRGPRRVRGRGPRDTYG